MAIKVDHKARKSEIVEKSIQLFARAGYRAVNYQCIADNCGVARTVLYRYFKNKRQVFDAAIEVTANEIGMRYRRTLRSNATADERLRRICSTVTTTLFEKRDFLVVILEFIIEKIRAGHKMGRLIERYTIGVKRIMQDLILEAKKAGLYSADLDSRAAMRILYSLFESTSIRLMVGNAVLPDCLEAIDVCIDSFKIPGSVS